MKESEIGRKKRGMVGMGGLGGEGEEVELIEEKGMSER